MQRLTLLLAVLLAGLCHGAPAPLPREPQVRAGTWQLRWGAATGPLHLGADGAWDWRSGDLIWLGTWRWDERTRTLYVDEHRADGAEPYSVVTSHVVWRAVLDRDLRGQAVTTYGAPADVRITRPGR